MITTTPAVSPDTAKSPLLPRLTRTAGQTRFSTCSNFSVRELRIRDHDDPPQVGIEIERDVAGAARRIIAYHVRPGGKPRKTSKGSGARRLLRHACVDRIAHAARQAKHRPTKVYVGNRRLVGDRKRKNFSIMLAQDFRSALRLGGDQFVPMATRDPAFTNLISPFAPLVRRGFHSR